MYQSGLCGPVSISIKDAETYEDFLTLDTENGPNTLNLESLDFGDAQDYDVVIVLTLDDYPEVSQEVDFKVSVEDCPVT